MENIFPQSRQRSNCFFLSGFGGFRLKIFTSTHVEK